MSTKGPRRSQAVNGATRKLTKLTPSFACKKRQTPRASKERKPAVTRTDRHSSHPGLQTTSFCASGRSEEHTSELQSLMRISYAVFCLKKNTNITSLNNYTK